jgi:hypothetical protein
MKDEGGRVKNRRSGWLVGVAAVGVMAACGACVSGLDATIHPADAPAGLDAHETHASASLLGQFRSSASAWLWLRTDLYLHNGVEMRPMTDWEKSHGRENHGAAKGEELMDESSVVTLVPPAERDFRGIFGDIERATSAYSDMRGHKHNDPMQALPLFRLMTWLDPKFVTGWTVGGAVLARDRSEAGTAKALAYLQEGLSENPSSIGIHAQIGELLATRRRDFEGAVKVLERARQIALDSKAISPDEKEDLRTAYRWLGLSYKSLGHRGKLQLVMQEAVRAFPDDLVFPRLMRSEPLVLAPQDEEHVHGPGCGHDEDH